MVFFEQWLAMRRQRHPMLTVEGKWIWDSWYCRDDQGLWHAFFLQADRSLGNPELRHWNVTWGLATSPDLRKWTYRGTVFRPSKTPSFDDLTIWTGCVVRNDRNSWTLFYTGTSRAEEGKIQRIGRASSADLVHWRRQGLALERTGENAEYYEGCVPRRWKDCSLRDPWVIRDPEGSGWLMYFTARSPMPSDTNASGAIGVAHSHDLVNWQLQPPVYVGSFGEIEVPQVFQRGDKWFCLFCTHSQCWSEEFKRNYPGEPVAGIHYLAADHPLGPWKPADGPFLYGTSDCEIYAGRLLTHGEQDYLLAFISGPEERFSGTICDPIPIHFDACGRLALVEPRSPDLPTY
ncbi:MAG: levansucrase [Mesorhizobium sp.]|nr:MAG: levansucrase [Mesorhizobium sp.]